MIIDWSKLLESSLLALLMPGSDRYVIAKNFHPRIAEYVEKSKDIWLELPCCGRGLSESDQNNLQKCENILQISFMKPTYDIIVNLHSAASGNGIARYVPKLKRETRNNMVETIVNIKKNFNEELNDTSSYLEVFDRLVRNITCFESAIQDKIRDEFYKEGPFKCEVHRWGAIRRPDDDKVPWGVEISRRTRCQRAIVT